MKNSRKILFALLCLFYIINVQAQQRIVKVVTSDYELWYDEPANNRGGVIPVNESERPIDADWNAGHSPSETVTWEQVSLAVQVRKDYN